MILKDGGVSISLVIHTDGVVVITVLLVVIVTSSCL